MSVTKLRGSYPVPRGPGMRHLTGRHNRHWRKLFWRLSSPQQENVRSQAERYYTTCARWEVNPDESFFAEVITDAKTGKFK